MYNLWVLYYFFQKSLFTENYFLIAATNFVTRGPLYTCLVTYESYRRKVRMYTLADDNVDLLFWPVDIFIFPSFKNNGSTPHLYNQSMFDIFSK